MMEQWNIGVKTEMYLYISDNRLKNVSQNGPIPPTHYSNTPLFHYSSEIVNGGPNYL
jgi:hypothetical protein